MFLLANSSGVWYYREYGIGLCSSGVARGGAGGRPPPLAETLPPLLPPQMKLHFVQRSMESRHFESKSAPPAHPSAPLAAPSF